MITIVVPLSRGKRYCFYLKRGESKSFLLGNASFTSFDKLVIEEEKRFRR